MLQFVQLTKNRYRAERALFFADRGYRKVINLRDLQELTPCEAACLQVLLLDLGDGLDLAVLRVLSLK